MRFLIRATALLLLAPCVSAFAFQTAPGGQDSLLDLYKSKRFFEMRDAMANRRDDRSDKARFFRGVVDNKFNRLKESLRELERYRARAKGDDPLRRECLELLADGYVKTCQYRKAAQTYETLLRDYQSSLTPTEAAGYKNVATLWGALGNVRPQTVAFRGDSKIPPSSGRFGTRMPVEANGQLEPFLVDTGANISTIMESYAKKLGMTMIDTAVQVGSITGAKVEAHLAVAPELKIGNALVRNAVFLVFEDRHLTFSDGFKIEGLIGFPVVTGLGEVTFGRDGSVVIPAKPSQNGEANLFLDGLKAYVAADYHGKRLTFAFDTGASSTDLYVPFFKAFEEEIKQATTPTNERVTGVGGTKEVPAYVLKDLVLQVAGKEARLKRASVLTEVLHEDGRTFHGNMGQDVVRQFDRMTLNFRTMSLVFE